MTAETGLLPSDLEYLARQRVAHFATADSAGRPHVVPVCFVVLEGTICISLDAKPKRVEATRLKRVRNLTVNRAVSFLVDEYDENWEKLSYLLVQGLAELREPDAADQRDVVALLRAKYPQYETMPIDQARTIRVRPISVSRWSGKGGISS